MQRLRLAIGTVLGLILLAGCEPADEQGEYQPGLVVFANLSAGMPMVDTCYVSRTGRVGDQIDIDQLRIEDALVVIYDSVRTDTVRPVPGRPGRYLTDPEVIFLGGHTYYLMATQEGDTVWAETHVPAQIEFTSPEGVTFTCRNQSLEIPAVNVDNFHQNIAALALALAGGDFSQFTDVDTVVYRKGDCYTESFASAPYFVLDFDTEAYPTLRFIALALESRARGLEPFEDLNANGQWDAGLEPFLDYNNSQVRDSTFSNIIYDTTLNFQIWKGPYFRDHNNDPFRQNPFVWTVGAAPLHVGWLFFNYYGMHLIVLQVTDQAFRDYFSGDPLGVNQYLLPDSNIRGGYGLFSATFSKSFFVYITPEP